MGNSCLQETPGWYGLGNCAIAIEICSSQSKDMHRCCPETCNTGALDEVACNALSGEGTCIYPNEAQCVPSVTPNDVLSETPSETPSEAPSEGPSGGPSQGPSEGPSAAKLADNDLLGSCSYTDSLVPTCIEFRGEGQDTTCMTKRCAKETDSTLVLNHACPAAVDPLLAGWCAHPLDCNDDSTIVEASPMMNPAECAENKMLCETSVLGTWIAAANCLLNEGPCPQDSDSCLQDSPGWTDTGDCASAVEMCTTWAKDMHRCCPETCDTGALDEVACNALSGKGTCNHPNEAQCVLDTCIFNERISETCAVLYSIVKCYPLGPADSFGNGRCGPSYGSTSCPEYAPFCNEDNGWCGASSAHQNAQPTTTYDYCIPSGPSSYVFYTNICVLGHLLLTERMM